MTHFLLSSPRDQKFGWRYLGNKEGFWWWAGVKTTRFFKAFDIVKKGDFCILEFRIFGSGGLSWEQEEQMEIRWWQNYLIFESFSSITYKHTWIFGLWIWGILDFWISVGSDKYSAQTQIDILIYDQSYIVRKWNHLKKWIRHTNIKIHCPNCQVHSPKYQIQC